jgi:hypothetical protein
LAGCGAARLSVRSPGGQASPSAAVTMGARSRSGRIPSGARRSSRLILEAIAGYCRPWGSRWESDSHRLSGVPAAALHPASAVEKQNAAQRGVSGCVCPDLRPWNNFGTVMTAKGRASRSGYWNPEKIDRIAPSWAGCVTEWTDPAAPRPQSELYNRVSVRDAIACARPISCSWLRRRCAGGRRRTAWTCPHLLDPPCPAAQ